MHHLVSMNHLTEEEIMAILDRAETLKNSESGIAREIYVSAICFSNQVHGQK